MAYQAAVAAGTDPNGAMPPDDPSSVRVVRWVMDNAHCGWLIGKGGSGIKNIEVTYIPLGRCFLLDPTLSSCCFVTNTDALRKVRMTMFC